MKTIHVLAALAAIAGTATSCGHRQSDAQKASAPEIEVSPVKVDSVTLYKKFPGTLIANASVAIVARVNGIITGKYYNSGDKVAKGALLFTIESEPYSDAVKQAEATLATARSSYDYASHQRAAMEKAYKSDAVSEMELEQARSSEREAEASIKNAEAALSSARAKLGYCRVTAPIAGRVSDNILSVGNYVSGEGEPVTLCNIYDNSSMIAVFGIEDVALAHRINNSIKEGLKDIPLGFGQKLEHEYTGRMLYVAPDMSSSTGTLTMQTLIDNPCDELRPGMYVDVSLPTGVDPEAILVRDASLSTDQLGKFLYTVNDSDRVVYTHVQVGELADDSMRIVTSGLKPGDRYVTSAMLKVRDGMTIKPIEQKTDK
jgi:RND family efflux transporter MFP subunit